MSGSSGNLVAVELRRHDHRERGVDGTRIHQQHDDVDEVITDYTRHGAFPAVTTDGLLTPAQRSADAQAADLPTRLVPSRRRVRTTRQRGVSPTDERTEQQVLKSTVEGLSERVSVLENGMQHLLQQRFPNGIPYDGTRTS